jgi:uncharacterized protein (TIGR02145 family)
MVARNPPNTVFPGIWMGKQKGWRNKMKKAAIMLTLLCATAFAQQKGSFTDPRDKKTYKTTKIGTQTWMAQNLNFNASGSKCYENQGSYCQKYGRLYNWNTALNVCPKGWHLPSNAEWDKLYRFADGTSGTESPYKSETAGKLLKTTSGWVDDGSGTDGNGTDKYGFSALPGGYYDYHGDPDNSFYFVGCTGVWWSASQAIADSAYYRVIDCQDGDTAGSLPGIKYDLYSVRCLQD